MSCCPASPRTSLTRAWPRGLPDSKSSVCRIALAGKSKSHWHSKLNKIKEAAKWHQQTAAGRPYCVRLFLSSLRRAATPRRRSVNDLQRMVFIRYSVSVTPSKYCPTALGVMVSQHDDHYPIRVIVRYNAVIETQDFEGENGSRQRSEPGLITANDGART
jgi:hypothetical protein